MMSIAQGIDPDAQQAINDFIIFKNIIERTNLPTRNDVHFTAYLDFVGKAFWPDDPDNPFTELAYTAARSFMAKDGKKSDQFVKLMQKSPDIIGLQTPSTPGPGEQQQGSILNRFFNRGNEE